MQLAPSRFESNRLDAVFTDCLSILRTKKGAGTAIAPSLPLHPIIAVASTTRIRNAPDWTRTSMPIKAQALNLPCIPNSTTGAVKQSNYTYQERELSSEISIPNHQKPDLKFSSALPEIKTVEN